MGQKQNHLTRAARHPARKAVSGRKPVTERKAALTEIADMLCAVAVGCCARHRRYSELVERGASDLEQRAAIGEVRISDELLDEAVDLYELACLGDTGHAEEPWWRRANMVWRTAEEYLRHYVASNRMTSRRGTHDKAALRELRIEYELEGSALLRLRHAIDSYRVERPLTTAKAST